MTDDANYGRRQRGLSFLERLNRGQPNRRVHRLDVDFESVVHSIKENLNKILNARKGHSMSAPDLGLIDLNDATNTESDVSAKICLEIRKCILEYEPRVKEVEVSIVPDYDNPTIWRISAMVTVFLSAVGDKTKEAYIDILYANNKRYYVEV